MPGPSAFVTPLVAASGENADALDLRQLRLAILMTDAACGVTKTSRGFEIDSTVLKSLPSHIRTMIAATVARANCDPLAAPEGMMVQGASLDSWARTIEELAKPLPVLSRLVPHVRQVIEKSETRVAWWGVVVDLPQEAAKVLGEVAGHDFNALLTLLVPVIPKAAAIVAITVPAGTALQSWINAANGPHGVRLELVCWILPWVSRLERGQEVQK